jgi:hypothetical protein
MEEASAYVYFAQPGDELVVKIGIAVDLAQRLTCIQTYHHREVRLLGAIDMRRAHGDGRGSRVDYWKLAREKEREIHFQLSANHLRGEWFRLTPQLISFIRAACNVVQADGESIST